LLLEETGSVVGYWAMGHGHPMQGQIAPLTWIPRGVPHEQYADHLAMGLSTCCDSWVRQPYIPSLQQHKQVCHSRSEFHSDEEWQGSELVTKYLQPLGIDNWMIAVRYPAEDNWSSLTLFRAIGRPDYTAADRILLDIVLASKDWLHYRLSTAVQVKASELTNRNASVLFMLLDGRSRKEIAANMNLSLHMVNDSIKSIYRHFGTSSATELAARFLRGA
jgi:DNA-binding CsgD family transcriptional regulator